MKHLLKFANFLPTRVISSLYQYVIRTAVERVPFKELLSLVYYTGSVPRVWSMCCGYIWICFCPPPFLWK